MMGKMNLRKNRGRIGTAAMVFVLLLIVLVAAALRMEKTTVEGEALDFTSERWDVESGKTLGGNSDCFWTRTRTRAKTEFCTARKLLSTIIN